MGRYMLTEQNAMKKRCYRDLSSTCVGSMCMAWRWFSPAPEIEIFRRGESDADFVKRRDHEQSKRMGFCGVAGIPSH